MEALGGFNGTVAGWGTFHDIKCTTNEHGPSQNERCKFPFEEKTLPKNGSGTSDEKTETVSYNSCTFAGNPATKNIACKEFYHNMHKLQPFPKFPVVLKTENRTIVCHNNTHGRFGWCRTQKNAKDNSKEEKNLYPRVGLMVVMEVGEAMLF